MNDLEKLKLQLRECIDKNSDLEINSSGTTGMPKTFKLNIKDRFEKCKKIIYPAGYKIGFFYDLNTWAGVSVLIHCIKNNIEAVHLNYNSPELINVDHVCLSPTQCLYLAQTKTAYEKCRQVTLGGEYARQKHLDSAKNIFPNAKITHVYASTETGDICSVSDGLEGVPARKFQEYKVLDDKIIINGIELKDVWSLRDERYYFLRRSDMVVKIGSEKVNLEEIESAVLDSIREVTDCVLYTKKSPFGNMILCFEYTGIDSNDRLKKYFSRFVKGLRPMHYSLVENLLTKNGKKQRRR